MSVHVVRGPRAALQRHFVGQPRPGALCVAQAPGRFDSFGALRRVFVELRARAGDALAEAVLARHAPAAALLLPGRVARLKADERRAHEALQARPTSHLTHNFVVQTPTFEAYAALLHDWLTEAAARAPLTLVVPDLSQLGWEDGALLKAVYRRRDPRLPELVLGFDPEADTSAGPDGVIWSMTAWKTLSLALDMQALQERPPLVLDDDGGDGGTLETQAAPLTSDADDLEAAARADLARAVDPLPDDVAARALVALRAAFAAFGFTSVLELGQALLRRGARWSPNETADVHALVALAAHDRQFVSDSNLALAALIQEHLEAALALETRPEERAALLYRLAVVHGRRRRDAAPALACTEQALAACRDARLTPLAAAYQETWARNVRALALVQARRLDDARAETLRGFELIDGLVADLPALDPSREPGALERDLRATHSLLAFNTRTLLDWLGGDAAVSAAWLARSQAAVRELPGLARFEALHWTDQHRRLGRPDLALRMALRGLEASRAAGDALRAYQHGLQAAELAALTGDAPTVCRLARDVQTLRARCGLAPLSGLDLLAALACARAGLHDEAAHRLARALESPAHATPDLRAPLLARLALVEGARAHASRAQALLEEALPLARASGERDTLLRVAAAAGRHLLRFGPRAQAERTLLDALGIADAPGTAPPPPGEVLAVTADLYDCGLARPELLARALQAGLLALEDADALHEMARLVERLNAAQDLLDADGGALLARARDALAWRRTAVPQSPGLD